MIALAQGVSTHCKHLFCLCASASSRADQPMPPGQQTVHAWVFEIQQRQLCNMPNHVQVCVTLGSHFNTWCDPGQTTGCAGGVATKREEVGHGRVGDFGRRVGFDVFDRVCKMSQ